MAKTDNLAVGPQQPKTAKKYAKGSPGGVNQQELVRQNNRWRENYNALRGLVLRNVVALLEAGERGEFADLQWLYRMVEKRFPVLRSLILRRRSALTKLDWDIKLAPEVADLDENDPEDKKLIDQANAQREFLKERYNLICNLKEAIRFLALAEFRGYSILQKHRFVGGEHDGAVEELHWLPQWNFVRDGLFGDWYWNAEAASGATWRSLGEENRIDPEDFIIREVEMPVNEIAVIAYLRSNLSLKDWDAFVEIFGLTGCVVIMPPNIPEGKEEEYKASAQLIAEGASGTLPNGGDAKFPAAAVRANAPFKEHLEWQEKDVVLAGTGGKLAMLTASTGMNSNQADVHEDAFDEIARAEAGDISELFQHQFDKGELAEAFPGQPVLAYFELTTEDETAQARLDFKREVFKQLLVDGTVADVLANQTDLKQLTQDVELPVNEEYTDPYLPVTTEQGALVTGETVKDSEGDIIGAQPEEPKVDQSLVTSSPTIQRGAGAKAGALPITNRGPDVALQETARDQYAAAVAEDLRSVREKVRALLQISDDQVFQQRAREMVGEIERVKQDILRLPRAAQVLAEAEVAALFNGLTEKPPRK